MLRFLRCYYLHFTRHSELLRASFIVLLFLGHGSNVAEDDKGVGGGDGDGAPERWTD